MRPMVRVVVVAILAFSFVLPQLAWSQVYFVCRKLQSHQELLHLHELFFDLLRGGRPGPVRRERHGRGPLFPQRGCGLRVEGSELHLPRGARSTVDSRVQPIISEKLTS